MARLIAVVGAPSTGKTTSLRNLKPEETYIMNILSKDLPWRGSAAQYSADKKNMANVDTEVKIRQVLTAINDSRPDIKQIILDDLGFVMSIELFKRAKEQGYTKFLDIGQQMFNIVQTAKNLRDDLTVVFIFHEESNYVDGQTPQRKIKTIGKMLDEKFDPQAMFTVVLYTHVSWNERKEPMYQFVTNNTGDYPAKSPSGMFASTLVPNDLNEIINEIRSYYEVA